MDTLRTHYSRTTFARKIIATVALALLLCEPVVASAEETSVPTYIPGVMHTFWGSSSCNSLSTSV